MNKQPMLYVICGLPASGKSTYAKELIENNENTVIYSSDSIREELYGDEAIQGDANKVFTILHNRVRDALKNGINVVVDSTNIRSKQRRGFVKSLSNIDCYKTCIIMATPYRECLERNRNRERVVPKEVIERMYRQWDTPAYFEGWNHIEVKYAERKTIQHTPQDFAYSYINFDQKNPHHSMTLGEHCLDVAEILRHYPLLYNAGLVHDCGKVFTRTNINSKGEKTDVNHYYNHEHVGAYEALFFRYPGGINALDVSVLVNLHMKLYQANEFDIKYKYKKLWGEQLFKDISRLHNADMAAH